MSLSSDDAPNARVSLFARVGVFLAFCAALLAPEALRLPRLYRGDFRSSTSRVARLPPPPPDARAPTSPFFHPRRDFCEPSWHVPVASPAPYCHTQLQCALMHLGFNFSFGFFVEAGAFDGVHGSHSLMFERHLCWKGLLFEPSARFFGIPDKWGAEGGPAARPESLFVNAAIVDSAHNGVELFAGIDSEPTNSVPQSDEGQAAIAAIKPGAKKVFGYSVAHMLRQLKVGPRGVDFFTLDIESYEIQALNGLEEFRPTVMVIETWNRGIGATEAEQLQNPANVRRKMIELGYTEQQPPAGLWSAPTALFSDTLWRYTAGP
jgi:hypothetical protein